MTQTSDPILREMDWLLDDPELFRLCAADMRQHYAPTDAGRPSVALEVIYRLTGLRRRKQWSLRRAQQEVDDSLCYRDWVRVYDQAVPHYSTLNELERAMRPDTLRRMNERLLGLAQAYELTCGYRLRVDSTVSESPIAYPTDSGLLLDGVQVVSRLLQRAGPYLPAALPAGTLCRNRTRSARRRARQIGQLGRRAGRQTRRTPTPTKQTAVRRAYADLIGIARQCLAQATQVVAGLRRTCVEAARRVCAQLVEFMPLVERVIAQTVQRVMCQQAVAASSKLVSVFEPHTQIIVRGKTQPPTEFGHKVNFGEVEHGLICHWQVVATGNPPDEQLLQATLTQHRKVFGHAPTLLAADRGFFSPANEQLAQQQGIQQIALPHKGYKTTERRTHEKQKWFKHAQRFRNGIEGRISVVRRTVQLKRCPYHGLDGFERWTGWGVFVANLVIMARLIHQRASRRRRRQS